MAALGMYQYGTYMYTGTIHQPDCFTLFFQPKDGSLLTKIKYCSANFLSLCPLISTCTAIPRIIAAVSVIFAKLSKISDETHRKELWNAFKNLIRGCVQFVPIAGNICLLIYDSIRSAIYVDKLCHTLKGSKDVVGIAIEGKSLFQIPVHKIKQLRNGLNTDQKCLEIFEVYVKEMLCQCEKNTATSKLNVSQLLAIVPSMIDALVANKVLKSD